MFNKTFARLVDIVAPKECVFCGRIDDLVCGDCRQLFDIFSTHKRYRSKNLADIYAAASYQNRFVKGAVIKFKYEPFLKNLKTPLAAAVCDHLGLIEDKPDFCGHVLAAVPLSKKRTRWRGFNQAEELAAEISNALRVPLFLGLLEKTRDSAPQAALASMERRQNVKGTIKCKNPGLAAGKKILLVDDIFTTGATMEECAAVLLESGAKTVTGLAVARSEING